MGSYFYMIHRNIKSRAALHPICARLIPAALVLLFCAITTPYLPEELPLKSVLHIVFAFFIRSAGAFVPVLDNPDQVSDRARSIQAFSCMDGGSHCGGVRNPFGGGRNHQQRIGDLCDADIRCHGAASGLQGCRTGGNAGQRWRHIRKSFAEKISGKTPQSSIDIKNRIYI